METKITGLKSGLLMLHMSEKIQNPEIRVPKLAVSKRFGMYKKEEKKEARLASIKTDRAFEKLMRAWSRYGRIFINGDAEDAELYQQVLAVIEDLRYSARAVEQTSIAISEFQHDDEFRFYNMAGFFLSALANNGKSTRYRIDTRSYEVEFTNIGILNIKNLTIHGHAGIYAGFGMISGTITVFGNAGRGLGDKMTGGKIIINGDVELADDVGDIRGIGSMMKGGEIHINGGLIGADEIGSSEIIHGKIFHKGKLIVDK